MWKQPRFSCRLSFLLNKKKETRASFLPCYSSAQNSNTNFGSQWWSPSPHWLASSALRLFNHPRVDGHEIINNRGDSSIHLPSDEKSSIKSFSRVKLTGIRMIIHASSIHPLPREQTRSKHPRKCRPGVGLGLVEPFYGGEGIVILLWLIVEERKRKGEGESINSDALEIPLLPFENASNAWLVLILGHESFKIKQFRFI